MKRKLLLMALALFTTAGLWAQDETIVHKKSLMAVIEDATYMLNCDSYASGQSDLESAISTAKTDAESAEDDETVRSIIITLQEAIDAFIAENAIDATEKVQNQTFNKDATNATNITGWVSTNMKQNSRSNNIASTSSTTISYFAEQWANSNNGKNVLNSDGDIHQDIAGLPAGHYRLTVDILACFQGAENPEESDGLEIYANEQVREFGTTKLGMEAGVNFGVDVDIEKDETLTIGFRFNHPNVNWVVIDNVKLYYAGSEDDWNAAMDVERIAAARETLTAAITAAKEAKERDNAVFYKSELQDAIDDAQLTVEDESSDLTTLEEATTTLNDEVKKYNTINTSYARLQKAIADAEELAKTMPEGLEEFQQAINTAKGVMSQTIENFTADPDYNYFDQMVDEPFDNARAALNEAMDKFRMGNASYAHPANVITNGDMSSMNGWTCLNGGTANPALHINTSGNITGFTKPFMECWVKNPDAYGQENYATQTVTTLPNGKPLPVGYYILKASAVAVQQSDVNTPVTGVQIRLNDKSVDVHTGNGIAEVYTLEMETTAEGQELTFGLYIDATTTANWIAWDEVELQFVGPKDKYMADKAAAELGQILEDLKDAVAEAKALVESVDANGVDISKEQISVWITEGEAIIASPAGIPAELVEQTILQIKQAIKDFYICGVSPKQGSNFDFTNMLVNPNFDTDAAGWSLTDPENMVLPTGTDCVSWWFGSSGPTSLVQDVYQTITGMPAGNYLLKVRAAIRLGGSYRVDEYTDEIKSTIATDYSVYANDESALIHPFFYVDEEKGLTLENMLGMTNDYDYRHGNGTLMDNMLKADNDYYDTYVPFSLDEKGDIKIGFRVEIASTNGSMPFFDYFNLFYYGAYEPTAITAPAVEAKAVKAATGVYSLNGQLLRRNTSVEGLPKGLYIVGGKKLVVK